MKGVLLLNGTPYTGRLPQGVRIYCCDGAYHWAKGRAQIYKNIGDFDSLEESPVPPPEEIYPSEKNFTDGEIALRKMLADGVDDIEIYGGFGGREDHFIGNLQLLYYCAERSVPAKMISEDTEIFAARGGVAFNGLQGKTISVFPFSVPLHIMESEGLKYSYPPQIGFGECRGVSNIVLSQSARIVFGREDIALVIINKGNV